MSRARPKLRQVVWRGLHRRCPRCGEGPLFERWFTLRPRCPACDLVFEQRPGDTWAFWIFGDRIFIALLLLVIVLGFRSPTLPHVFVLFLVTAIPLVVTMPHRLGVCVGLDYLIRSYSEDSSEGG